METVINNWYLVFAIGVLAVVGGYAVYRFVRIPRPEQLEKVQEWLLYAVTEAEKALGGGTGQLKLRHVYDMFVARFPWMAKLITFAEFSDMVDEALVHMRDMIEKNDKVKDYTEGMTNNG